jgi:hypothetical protein
MQLNGLARTSEPETATRFLQEPRSLPRKDAAKRAVIVAEESGNT